MTTDSCSFPLISNLFFTGELVISKVIVFE